MVKNGNPVMEKGDSYESRDWLLTDLGFENYADYLDSSLWADIRSKVYSKKGTYCVLCDDVASEIHHQLYSRAALTGSRIDNLYPVCHDCHHGVEFHADGTKRDFKSVRSVFDEMLQEKRSHDNRDGDFEMSFGKTLFVTSSDNVRLDCHFTANWVYLTVVKKDLKPAQIVFSRDQFSRVMEALQERYDTANDIRRRI